MKANGLLVALLLCTSLWAAEPMDVEAPDAEFLEFLGEWDEFEAAGVAPLEMDDDWLARAQQAEDDEDE